MNFYIQYLSSAKDDIQAGHSKTFSETSVENYRRFFFLHCVASDKALYPCQL